MNEFTITMGPKSPASFYQTVRGHLKVDLARDCKFDPYMYVGPSVEKIQNETINSVKHQILNKVHEILSKPTIQEEDVNPQHTLKPLLVNLKNEEIKMYQEVLSLVLDTFENEPNLSIRFSGLIDKIKCVQNKVSNQKTMTVVPKDK